MACYEVRCCDLICRADRLDTEKEEGASDASRLLRVIREESLAVLVGVLIDNLNRDLVGTNSTVGTQTEALALLE